MLFEMREIFELAIISGAALTLTGLALFSMCRNLFGFGVPLEAVDYPRLSEPDFAFLKHSANLKHSADSGDGYWNRVYPDSVIVTSKGIDKPPANAKVDEARPVLRLHMTNWPIQESLPDVLNGLKKTVAPKEDAKAGRPRLLLVFPESTPERPNPEPSTLLEVEWKEENKPPYDEANAPWLAMLVSADDNLRHRLTDYASESFDLFEDRKFWKIEPKLNKASSGSSPIPLIIVHNLELLLRNDLQRQEALRVLEQMVLHQKQERKANKGYRILLLADISPLDRFLQASEFREEQEEAGASDGMSDASESIRWSRLLENFTTYTRRIRARVSDVNDVSKLPNGKPRPNLAFLLRELNHIPDRVVQALLPDGDGVLTVDEILTWGKFLENSRDNAISEFLASQLIEHYHYLWSISSRAEQILIHRFAAGELPNIRTAFALRSLVRRGIVVFDPAPRLMSNSFAEFIRHVERPELLSIWESNAPKGLWNRLHGNVTVVLPLLVLLGAIIMLRGSVGLEAAIPLVLAAGPALLNALIGGRRAA